MLFTYFSSVDTLAEEEESNSEDDFVDIDLVALQVAEDVKQKMEDQRREEEQSQGAVKKKRKFKNPFKRRPKTREEKIEAYLEN